MKKNKRILVLTYSQTGQLQRVVDRITSPLRDAGHQLIALALATETAFPYPWPAWQFLDSFPETVLQKPSAFLPLPLAESEKFDLVIVGYPVWFLSPPPALTAFLLSSQAQTLLSNTPVITVTACRNMWLMAQQSVKVHLARLGARHLDHIVLTDQGNTFATFITTPRWLLSGKKNAFWGFPAAGVSEADIDGCHRFGKALVAALAHDREQSGLSLLQGLRACTVDPRLYTSEIVGLRSFTIWGKLLHRLGTPGSPLRRLVLAFYLVFLICLIITVVPLTLGIKALLRPLLANKMDRLRRELELPSGSGNERMNEFT